jgi:uncharacterized protein YkwD
MKSIVIMLASFMILQYCSAVEQPALLAHEFSKKAFCYTNQFRAKKRLPRLGWHRRAAEIARKHSINMAQHKVPFGHADFDARVEKITGAQSVAENVYMANHRGDVAQKAVDGWIKSPGHLKNLVGDYKSCGIGVYKNDEGYWYFTQIFVS